MVSRVAAAMEPSTMPAMAPLDRPCLCPAAKLLSAVPLASLAAFDAGVVEKAPAKQHEAEDQVSIVAA